MTRGKFIKFQKNRKS